MRKPSMAELSCGGRGRRATRGSASTRPCDKAARSEGKARTSAWRHSKYSSILKSVPVLVIAPNLATDGGHRAIWLEETFIIHPMAR